MRATLALLLTGLLLLGAAFHALHGLDAKLDAGARHAQPAHPRV